MTTAQTTPAAEGGYGEAHAFANALRSVADVIDDGELTVPRSGVNVFCSGYGTDAKAAFRAARRAFPAAPIVAEGALTDNYVQIEVGKGVRLLFDKSSISTRTTAMREVTEYVIDPELLVSSCTAIAGKHHAACAVHPATALLDTGGAS